MSVWARSAAWGVLHAGLAPSCVTPQCLIVSRTECKGQSQGAQKIFMERVRFSCIPMLEMCVYRRAEKDFAARQTRPIVAGKGCLKDGSAAGTEYGSGIPLCRPV